MKKLSILTILFLSIMSAQPVYVPLEMSFQGFLTDSEGTAYTDGEYELTFRLIFENPAAPDNVIWEESHTTSVSNGVFSVILGSTTPLPQSIHPFVKLETQVGEEVLSPRQSFTTVPYALNSIRSASAYQSVLADTAMVAVNAPMAECSQATYNLHVVTQLGWPGEVGCFVASSSFSDDKTTQLECTALNDLLFYVNILQPSSAREKKLLHIEADPLPVQFTGM